MEENESPEVEEDSSDLKFKRRLEAAKAVSPVESLLLKQGTWLLQQPEWAGILAAPRKVRREAITLIAKRLVTIPNRYS
jgi:hypothetical protein